jgi:hypothetical protein
LEGSETEYYTSSICSWFDFVTIWYFRGGSRNEFAEKIFGDSKTKDKSKSSLIPRIFRGMTQDRVKELLGPPRKVVTLSDALNQADGYIANSRFVAESDANCPMWVYGGFGWEYLIHFQSGRVTKSTFRRPQEKLANFKKVQAAQCPECGHMFRLREDKVKPILNLTCKCGWQGKVQTL